MDVIAKETGIDKSTITEWRRENNWDAKAPARKDDSREETQEAKLSQEITEANTRHFALWHSIEKHISSRLAEASTSGNRIPNAELIAMAKVMEAAQSGQRIASGATKQSTPVKKVEIIYDGINASIDAETRALGYHRRFKVPQRILESINVNEDDTVEYNQDVANSTSTQENDQTLADSSENRESVEDGREEEETPQNSNKEEETVEDSNNDDETLENSREDQETVQSSDVNQESVQKSDIEQETVLDTNKEEEELGLQSVKCKPGVGPPGGSDGTHLHSPATPRSPLDFIPTQETLHFLRPLVDPVPTKPIGLVPMSSVM